MSLYLYINTCFCTCICIWMCMCMCMCICMYHLIYDSFFLTGMILISGWNWFFLMLRCWWVIGDAQLGSLGGLSSHQE